ncbi:MAG: peptidase family protein, partial [Thermoleophilia bacterium]|nr:peptidase family protein [Thermoleophilia bacterium]
MVASECNVGRADSLGFAYVYETAGMDAPLSSRGRDARMIDVTTNRQTTNSGIVPPWLQAAAPSVTGANRQSSGEGSAAQLAAAKSELRGIRNFFGELDVKPNEGNDEARVIIDPEFDNAEYQIPTDAVKIGFDPNTGASFTRSPDVLAHEWTHRIVHHLAYTDLDKITTEDLAIDESLADTFAAAYDPTNWTIGEGTGQAVRDLAHP